MDIEQRIKEAVEGIESSFDDAGAIGCLLVLERIALALLAGGIEAAKREASRLDVLFVQLHSTSGPGAEYECRRAVEAYRATPPASGARQ